MICLDLGCKTERVKNTIGVDIDPSVKPDIIHDLNKFPYPFDTNSVDKIYAKHIIEHLDFPIDFIKECHRILKPNGTFFIETPHFSSYVAYGEPQHKFFYSFFMFNTLLDRSKKNFIILKQEITFYKTFRFFGIKWLANKNPRNYEKFWTYIFPAENVIIHLKKDQSNISDNTQPESEEQKEMSMRI